MSDANSTMSVSTKVLVTGASGYVGSHVVQQLLVAGYQVRGTVRSVTNEQKVQHLRNLCPEAEKNLELVEADLLKADTWLPAVEGVDYVMHVASPFPSSPPEREDEEDLRKAAVEGTLHVLKACAKVSSVKRVVLTSSVVAVNWDSNPTEKVHTENDWSDVEAIDTYSRSKTMAEQAAWDFIKHLPDDRKLELAVLNPSVAIGPTLHRTHGTSTELLQKFLDRLIPAVPKMNFPFIDVRDIALAHLRAMVLPDAADHRHIVHASNMWLSEVANLLHVVFKSRGYSIPTLVAPNTVLKLAAKLDGNVRVIVPHLGVVHRFNNSRMREVLGIEPRNLRDSIIDMAHAMIQNGMVHKTHSYRGPDGEAEREKYLSWKLQ